MQRTHRNILLWAPILLIVGMVGCPGFKNSDDDRGPAVDPVPAQFASTGVETRVDLATFVSGGTAGLKWEVISGDGDMEASEYVNVFKTLGSYDVQFRVTNEAGRFTDSGFAVVVQSDSMAVVQRGNDLDLLDGAVGTLYPLASGGASPLVFRQRLPNGFLVYERMGASSIDLFVHDLQTTRQIGGFPGINTVYDTHTQHSHIFFEEGSASETGLYMWDSTSGATSSVAVRQGMHNRNAFVSASDICYFEYGNNGQSDIYMWRLGQQWHSTVFSSDYQEDIQTMMPDGGIVFSTKGLAGEDDLYYYRDGHGPFTVAGDLSPLVQGSDMEYKAHTSQSLVVVATASGSGDLWMWSPLGLTTRAVADTSAKETYQVMTPDGQVVYRVATGPGNEDLKIYHYSTDTRRDVAVSEDNEVFEAVLPNSDVIFAVEAAQGRALYRFDVVSGKTDLIAGGVGVNHSVAAVLANGFVVYHRSGAAEGTLLWDPGTGLSILLAGPGSSYAGQCAEGDFVINLSVNGQVDLAYWDHGQGKLLSVAQTGNDERFQAGFSEGVVIYSAVVAPKISADLFHWKRGVLTRISNGRVDYSVVAVMARSR